MATGLASKPRRDAAENRIAILNAARELFADSLDVPMCRVARRAGVGQATLYRNFPNRGALAAVILGERIDRLAERATHHEGDPESFFVLLRSVIEDMVQLYALAELVRGDPRDDYRLDAYRERIGELMAGPLMTAKAAGLLRPDMSVDDVFLLLMMARGVMDGAGDAIARSKAAKRMLALTVDGLGVPPRMPLRELDEGLI